MTGSAIKALPRDAVLLHIGPHKTGTTAIQGALAEARPHLGEQGVIYPGTEFSHHEQTRWAINPDPAPRHGQHVHDIWNALCAESLGHPHQRVVISSEMLDLATPEQAASIVDALGGKRVHVVITLRPLATMLSSIWQQGIQARGVLSFPEWLNEVFSESAHSTMAQKFWHQHQHAELLQRWVSVVGTDRAHVVVVDRSDPQFLYSSFEQLLGLSSGTLRSSSRPTNRTLTAHEVEFTRQINLEFGRRGLKGRKYRSFIRQGVNREFKSVAPDFSLEPRIETPAWAQDAAGTVAEHVVTGIEQSGVQIIGDIAALAAPQPAAEGTVPHEQLTEVPMDLAVRAVFGAIKGAQADDKSAKSSQLAKRLLANSSEGVALPRLHRIRRALRSIGFRR